jgi:hypothetical protein
VRIGDLFGLYQRTHEMLWGEEARENVEAFRLEMGQLFQTTVLFVKGVEIDENWSLCGVLVRGVGVCVVPLNCPVRIEHLRACPSEWGIAP